MTRFTGGPDVKRRLGLLGGMLTAVFALGVATATSASALPDISLTLIDLELTFNDNAGNLYTSIGYLLLLLTQQLTALGTFEELFLDVEDEQGEKCNSVGDPLGEVLTKGTFHIVYTILSPLRLGILFLYAPFTIICGAAETDIRGSELVPISGAGTEGTELVSILIIFLANGKGKPSLTTYYNDGGTAVKAKLEAEAGAGFMEAAEEDDVEITLLALKTNMFVITGR
jgi:hypothetical protein